MKATLKNSLLTAATLPAIASAACISSGNQATIQNALQSGGNGAVVQLCPGAVIQITDQISFTADNQEISTQGYPTDSSRGTIQVAPGSSASTLIYGKNFNNIRIKNLQLEGNRGGAGLFPGGAANIEIGGFTTGQTVSNVASRNPRGWSCLHAIGSGDNNNPCKNVTIVNNDIGPCGQSGTDANGNGQWADGISLDCTASLVQGNTINGPTDGGIVIFGSPGSTITGNTIISSPDYVGFGAINMVDGEYDGSYAGVSVTNNNIQGQKLFNLGIGIGANVWSFGDPPPPLKGPATVSGNTISGHVSFPIAINGWSNGLTVCFSQFACCAHEWSANVFCRSPETLCRVFPLPTPASLMPPSAALPSRAFSTRTQTSSTTLLDSLEPRTSSPDLSLPPATPPTSCARPSHFPTRSPSMLDR
ncbi:hypothetical protein TsFJ059_009169 [Trichoderma semiorbis]|uniref:Right handed beta helix domain-containing protein n=1 Tax=Trichoderma semiorbis TaxID=1491008 RepID=A0A9P8HKY5_9HYPO|nr:hypothetical protein TsFJ059_009169 [Trichoderma semiorbis]